MDPGSGKLYKDSEIGALPADVRERLVRVEGRRQDIEAIAAHVERGTRGERRRAARKAQKLARRKNRR